MKKTLTFLLIFICLFLFISCSDKNNVNNDKENNENEDNENQQQNTPISDFDKLILGQYRKDLDLLDEDLNDLIIEIVHKYVSSSFAIEQLGQINIDDLKSEDTSILLKDTLESWGDLFELSAIFDYYVNVIINKEINEVSSNNSSRKLKKLSDNSDEAVEWAKAITQKYDSIKGNQKLAELANYMGTDAKRAYQTLSIAQDVLKGEYANEEERAGEWLAVLNATKTASKVGVYLCATAATCGATGAITAAPTLTTSQTAGIIINGVDCVLTLGQEGANIILGEESNTTKCISTIAEIYSKCNYVYGIYDSPTTVGEKIAFISDTTEIINDSISYLFKVNPLAEGGQLITSVIDSNSNDYNNDAITDLKLGGAYNNDITNTTVDEFLEKEEAKLIGEELINNLEIENKEEVIAEFSKVHDEVSNIMHTDNGISYFEDSYKGYCYRNKNGYLDGVKIQYSEDSTYGKYIVEKRVYSNGVEIEYMYFQPDGLLTQHEYIDQETGMKVVEVYYDKNVESDLNPEIRGNKSYVEYSSISYPSKEKIDEYKEYGCYLVENGYKKTIRYNRINDNYIDSIDETNNGKYIYSCTYNTNSDGNRYIEYETIYNEDGNKVSKSYYGNSRLMSLTVYYSDGSSDGERYFYDVDDVGPFTIIEYYTNDSYVNRSNKIYDGIE